MGNKKSWIEKIMKLVKKYYFFSISYWYYKIIESENMNTHNNKEIKRVISEVMKYFFYCIDLIFIFFIVSINTWRMYLGEFPKKGFSFNIVMLICIIFIIQYCLCTIKNYRKNNFIEI